MAEERQCMCTTPEITIKLNKQGPQGKVGPQGEPGFSPYIGVANDTPSQYILRITNEDGEYLTPNLKANIPLGGSAGDVLTKNSDANGDCSFKALPYASTSQQGVVYLATTEEALLGDPDYAITGEVLLGVLANKIGNGTITITQEGVTKGTFTTNQAGNTSISLEDTTYTVGDPLYIDTGNVIKLYYDSGKGLYVNGQSLAVRVDGTTIDFDNSGNLSYVGSTGPSYSAGTGIDITNNTISIDDTVVATQSDIPTNYVTTDTTQTITGAKSFTSSLTFNKTAYVPIGFGLSYNNTNYSLLNVTEGGSGLITYIGGNNASTRIDGSSIRLYGEPTIYRSSTDYVNIDSGNISTYLPTINGGNANA